jgi:peptidyl-prolyl cis-trans isomerase D
VGEREIFDRDVTRAYEQSLNNLVGIDDFDEKKLRQEALDRLIADEVITQSATDRSLVVSDVEARGFIQNLPYFQTDGKFDKDKYKIMLSAQGMSPEQFVAQIRRALTSEQFQRGVAESAFVTKAEIESLMRLKSQERDFEYVKVPVQASAKTLADAEINAYYESHRADFRNPERVSIEYLALNLEDLAKGVEISEDDLKKGYEEQKSNFGSAERRKVAHILVALEASGEAAEKTALNKALTIQDRLKKGEDFAQLAQTLSSDTVSAKKGGDLGYLDPAAQEESFTKAAESLQTGAVSEPIKTSFGYHLIKLTELVPAKTKSFEEVRAELLKSMQRNRAETAFYEKGQKLAEITFEHPGSLDAAANQLGLKIQQTGLFTREVGEDIAADEAVRKVAFAEEVLAGKNSEPVELGNEKAVVLRVKEHQPASDKPLSEVKDMIIGKLREEDARSEASKRAQALYKSLNDGKSLVEAAKAAGLEVNHPGMIRRENDKLPPELVRAVFSAARPMPGKSSPGQVSLADGSQLILSVTAVQDGASASADKKEQEAGTQFLRRIGAQGEFGAFVAKLRELADVQIEDKE